MSRKPEYDPGQSQDREWWTSLDEQEQIDVVLEHHRRAGLEIPGEMLHALTHVIVENQILLEDATPVASTLERLIQEGLSRHEAIHAVGTALAPTLLQVAKGEIRSDVSTAYYERLRELTAESWLAG